MLFIYLLILSASDYDRGDYGTWIDADNDCQNTRTEILIAWNTDKSRDHTACTVDTGKWIDPYTHTQITDPSTIDIDHVVPLYEAHISGAYLWSADTKLQFANDIENLVPVGRSVNRSKGSKDVAEWQPTHYQCEYLNQWVYVKSKWQLEYDTAEREYIVSHYADICTYVSSTVG